MNVNRIVRWIITAVALGLLAGCGSGASGNRNFFTSGSKQADQRASQRMAKSEQLNGQSKNSKPNENSENKTLYDRLGGQAGVKQIVDDFIDRAMVDPRVNWGRKGIRSGGIFGSKSMEWKPTPGDIAQLKVHMAQFISLSTGGPNVYKGKEIHQVHKGMKITNAEFDAAVGDLKASLDKFGVANQDQKDLLSIVESTRVQIVEVR